MGKPLPNLCMLFRNEEVFMLSFVTYCLDTLITSPLFESGEVGKKPRHRLPVLSPVIQNVLPKAEFI